MNIWDKRRIAESMMDTLARLNLFVHKDASESEMITKFTFREMFGNA